MKKKEKIVKCSKCNGKGFYCGRYDSGTEPKTACDWCYGGRITMKELNRKRKELADKIKEVM